MKKLLKNMLKPLSTQGYVLLYASIIICYHYEPIFINKFSDRQATIQTDSTQLHIHFRNCEAPQDSAIVFGITNCFSQPFNGISIGFYNKTLRLEGVQIGIINTVETNPFLLRRLPFFNIQWNSFITKS